jgi:hypothetical protein
MEKKKHTVRHTTTSVRVNAAEHAHIVMTIHRGAVVYVLCALACNTGCVALARCLSGHTQQTVNTDTQTHNCTPHVWAQSSDTHMSTTTHYTTSMYVSVLPSNMYFIVLSLVHTLNRRHICKQRCMYVTLKYTIHNIICVTLLWECGTMVWTMFHVCALHSWERHTHARIHYVLYIGLVLYALTCTRTDRFQHICAMTYTQVYMHSHYRTHTLDAHTHTRMYVCAHTTHVHRFA